METDTSVLAVRAAHDPQSFAALYDRLYPRVYRYVRYRCEDETTAEDLVAQVFEQVVRDLGHYSPAKAPFEAWLFAIARHRMTDHHRLQAFRRALPWEALHPQPAPGPLPEERALQHETAAELQAALGILSGRERDLLGLKFGGGLSYAEIGALTGVKEGHAAVIVYRAIGKLRQVLAGQPEQDVIEETGYGRA